MNENILVTLIVVGAVVIFAVGVRKHLLAKRELRKAQPRADLPRDSGEGPVDPKDLR